VLAAATAHMAMTSKATGVPVLRDKAFLLLSIGSIGDLTAGHVQEQHSVPGEAC
jgi:hypothetical protein